MKKYIKIGISIIVVVLIIGGVVGYKKYSVYQKIDASYNETFPDFSAIKSDLADRSILIHMKTGFDYDDAQGCVAFNMAFAALKSGLDTTVLVDASGTYMFEDDLLYGYSVPLRMRKSLAAQADVDLADVPETYGALTAYLSDNGVKFVMNGTMNVVSGKRSEVYQQFDEYPFIKPLSTFEALNEIMQADRYLSY